jgi:predicted ATPase
VHRKFIITGGPGTGKTTLVNELGSRGYVCYDEIARRIITEQLEVGSDAVPWLNLESFSSLVLESMLSQYSTAAAPLSPVAFCDRGVPDIIAYLTASSLSIHQKYYEAIEKGHYERRVFVTPPWKEIYESDRIRTESYETSLLIYAFLLSTYRKLGFELVEIPRISVHERADFVILHAGAEL